MPTLAPSTVAEAAAAITTLGSSLHDPTASERADIRRTLTDIHRWLMRATPSAAAPPRQLLSVVTTLLAGRPAGVADRLAPRPRTVFRLLRAGQAAAAWAVLAENAVGVVDQAFAAATATGASRASSRLPLLTLVEAATVFAQLPGFRDPRFAAPDECYDITESIRLRYGVDEIYLQGTSLSLGGWAALDVLTADPSEVVTVLASGGGRDVEVTGSRCRRPDLVGSRGQALTRRVWAGWSAGLDLADPRIRNGSWTLSLQIDHAGVVRRRPLEAHHLGALARSATGSAVGADGRRVEVAVLARQVRLVCSGAASDTVGG